MWVAKAGTNIDHLEIVEFLLAMEDSGPIYLSKNPFFFFEVSDFNVEVMVFNIANFYFFFLK